MNVGAIVFDATSALKGAVKRYAKAGAVVAGAVAGGIRFRRLALEKHHPEMHEGASYLDVEPHYEGALQLGLVCHARAVHLARGTRIDFVTSSSTPDTQ
ncbi:hypothetical protein GALMADRAFT_150435 [Galerina marginata CBS 339.88]|uniref:Uncharacterized protein n=1 Tax=Galerina marginata (strain CBS 339.88) TaxID=685588 RepID=A0A067TUV7_GALM3|nr:hypothetical protein GALMADRAFT_150435 [Galerina marginata CBS 339.88]